MNNLANEISPYLLQHKDNPVHWQAWHSETLQMAIEQDKPILLSIGYAACHWCHVMEHECFEKQDVADVMNAHFINIKIDREERPDIDMIYMEAIQQMGLHGGWPLNVFLLPNQKPFYGGTYFPKTKWISILESIHQAFKNNRNELEASAEGFAQGIQNDFSVFIPTAIEEIPEIMPRIMERIISAMDPVFGGVQKAPKFPLPSVLNLIESIPPYECVENHFKQYSDSQLTRMAQGGIFDQLAGGFSRYSVDSEWFCPHFEKMLYDNAQLLFVYAKAYQRYPFELYKEVINQTIGFLDGELGGPNGLYFSAIDADSEGIEGAFYTWTYEELVNFLPLKEHRVFYEAYQILPNGNWEHGRNILFKQKPNLNSEFHLELSTLSAIRAQRIRPQTDTKQLLAWNAMLVTAFVEIGHSFQDEKYITKGVDLLKEINHCFFEGDLILHQTSYSSQPIVAFLDDLACLLKASIDVYLYTGYEEYLVKALLLGNKIKTEFTQDTFYSYVGSQGEQLIANKFEITDSVCPSSNSLICESFLWLGYLSNQVDYSTIGKEMVEKILEQAQANPIYYANWLRIYAEWFAYPKVFIKFDASTYSKLNLIKEDWPIESSMMHLIPNEKPGFMVCIQDQCLQPVMTLNDLKEQLVTLI